MLTIDGQPYPTHRFPSGWLVNLTRNRFQDNHDDDDDDKDDNDDIMWSPERKLKHV